jgi:hypothetical protein
MYHLTRTCAVMMLSASMSRLPCCSAMAMHAPIESAAFEHSHHRLALVMSGTMNSTVMHIEMYCHTLQAQQKL